MNSEPFRIVSTRVDEAESLPELELTQGPMLTVEAILGCAEAVRVSSREGRPVRKDSGEGAYPFEFRAEEAAGTV